MGAGCDVQVGSDEGASFGITDVLHLMPPLLYARSANVSDVPSEGHHGGVLKSRSGVCVCLVKLLAPVCRRHRSID